MLGPWVQVMFRLFFLAQLKVFHPKENGGYSAVHLLGQGWEGWVDRHSGKETLGTAQYQHPDIPERVGRGGLQ